MAQALPHALMYSAGQHMHYDISQYYTPAYAHFAPSPYPERTLKADRRRPKYTRSKTGCLTCRKKKVKCDETKPKCQRCANSSLDCNWPEPPPPKKKSNLRKRASTADDASASDAGTSSLSPTASGEVEGTPQLPYVSAPVSPNLGSGQAMQAPQMNYNNGDINLVQAAVADRRHSNPDIQTHLSVDSSLQSRRHSTQFTAGHQQYGQHMGNGGALGLSLNQQHQGNASRPSTPNDFLYPHAHAVQTQAHAHGSAGYPGYSPSGSMTILPNLSGSVSSRPSTASSLSLAHSLSRRTSAGNTASSRPSTAGSLCMSGTSAPNISRQYGQQHRPSSSCSINNGMTAGTGGGEAAHPLSYAHSPFSFNHSGSVSAGTYDASTTAARLGGYSQPVSRPGTANSVMQSSPYMRQHAASAGVATAEHWQASPMLGQSPLLAPHAQVPVAENYFQQMMHTPPMMPSPATHPVALSRGHSPMGAWN